MKTKEEAEALHRKLIGLSDEELNRVTGGILPVPIHLSSLEGFDYEVCMKDIAGFGSKNNPLILSGSRDYFLNVD